MKILHNTVLKMNGLYCSNICTLCLFSRHGFLVNSNWQNGFPLNFLCRCCNLTSFFLWIDFRFRRLHRFWHRLCCQMCSAHWSQPWCQSWTALGWDGCQGILEHRIWEKGKRDFCLNYVLCNHVTYILFNTRLKSIESKIAPLANAPKAQKFYQVSNYLNAPQNTWYNYTSLCLMMFIN